MEYERKLPVADPSGEHLPDEGGRGANQVQNEDLVKEGGKLPRLQIANIANRSHTSKARP